MKTSKRILSLLLTLLLIVSIVTMGKISSNAATFEDINNPSVFLKQNTDYTCTLSAAAMMMRRAALLNGDASWSSITETALRNGGAWLEGTGLYHSFSYAGITVSHASLFGDKQYQIISLLAEHPEGIVLYYHSSDYSVAHAILLTDYTNGIFYCADPANGVAAGRIPISNAYAVTINNATEYWYVSSPKCNLTSPAPNYADLGDDFYAVILNTACWKPITHVDDSCNIYLRTETNTANQVWRFQKQSDGAYVISSCKDGKALEMYQGKTDIKNNVSACSEFWGGNYQQWYLIPQGSGYIFLSKHYTDLNRVMDLEGGSIADGTPIQIYERNNTDAQIWSVYTGSEVQLTSTSLAVTGGTSSMATHFRWDSKYGVANYNLKIWKDNVNKDISPYLSKSYEDAFCCADDIDLPVGTYEAYITVNNHYQSYESNYVKFTVKPATVSSISIQSKPTKTVYTVGEKFDASGLAVKVTMSDGTTKTITSGFTLSNPDMSTVGTKTVTVTYSGKTTTFIITVKTATTGTLRAEVSNRAVLGQTVDIPIYVDCNAALGTIKFHVQYDKTKLQYVSCNENAFKNSVVNDNDPGKLVVACVTDGSVPAGKICVLRFKVIASSAGNTNLNFSAIEATDSVDAPINMSGGSYTLPLVQRYTVTYNANGGTGAPAAQTKYTGDSLKLSSVKPTRTGYTFLGWATSATATSAQYAAGGTYTGNANLTLYAVWKANTYTVTYNANGGTGATASSSHTYDSAKTLTANGFTRTGYTFLGWSTSSTATTATYTNKQSVKNLTATNGGMVTLYAVWQKNPSTVSSISIQSKPTKTVYTVGEKFEASGLKVKVTMSDGTTKTITSGFTLSNPDMSKAGTKSVTVTYSGKTVSFTITVKDANPPANTGALRLITPASARVGQRVQIPVQLDKASLGTLTFTVKYDHTKLKYVSCTESTFDMCDVYAGNTGVIRAACIDNDAVSAGHIAVLTFEVIAPSACLTDLTLVVEEAYDGSDKAVSVTGGTWELSVVKTVLGDLNGDGQVTAIDARWALQAASGTRTLNEEQKAAADINGDGKITAIDARWILQAASGTRVL